MLKKYFKLAENEIAPSLAPTLLQLDSVAALKQNLIGVIFIFFFLDLFDTVGSLIGIAKQAGLLYTMSVTIEGQQLARTFTLYPVTSPALIVVGSLMMRSVRDVEWDDFTEALPAFLTLVLMPLTFSITDGIAFGFISYALLKPVTDVVEKFIG
jgi:adenine/guanine/hypoxanthine permease